MGIRGGGVTQKFEVLRGVTMKKLGKKGVILKISGTAATKYFYSYFRPKIELIYSFL